MDGEKGKLFILQDNILVTVLIQYLLQDSCVSD